jgi:hypothetical protein
MSRSGWVLAGAVGAVTLSVVGIGLYEHYKHAPSSSPSPLPVRGVVPGGVKYVPPAQGGQSGQAQVTLTPGGADTAPQTAKSLAVVVPPGLYDLGVTIQFGAAGAPSPDPSRVSGSGGVLTFPLTGVVGTINIAGLYSESQGGGPWSYKVDIV